MGEILDLVGFRISVDVVAHVGEIPEVSILLPRFDISVLFLLDNPPPSSLLSFDLFGKVSSVLSHHAKQGTSWI